jgi:tetratricopeptide (TPR) repeat protein
MNGELYYYYAYTLESLGKKDEMMRYYQKAIDDGSQNPYVFGKLIDQYKADNDRANIEKTLAMAKAKNPDNMSVKLLEIDYAYWSGDSVKAKRLVDQIDPQVLKTSDEMVNVANFYIKEKRYEEADRLLTATRMITIPTIRTATTDRIWTSLSSRLSSSSSSSSSSSGISSGVQTSVSCSTEG